MTPHPAMNLIPIVLVFFIMYFLLIRPQAKREREQGRMQSRLKKNDQVVTVGGVHGTVVNVKEQVVTLRVDENVRIDVEKSSIARLVKEG